MGSLFSLRKRKLCEGGGGPFWGLICSSKSTGHTAPVGVFPAPPKLSLPDFNDCFALPLTCAGGLTNCGHCPCFLWGPGPQERTGPGLSLYLRVLSGPRGCLLNGTHGLEGVTVTVAGASGYGFRLSLPSVYAAPRSHKTSQATGLFFLGLPLRVSDVGRPCGCT